MKLKNNTIFIADSHFNINRTKVLDLLLDINNGKIITNQIFLMGDIFDFLSEQISYFKIQNRSLIDIINNLAKKIKIIYFEGNHDFNLKDIFINVLVIKREQQPFNLEYNNGKILLSHGDIFTPFFYNTYCLVFRSKYIQNILNIIDINNCISTYMNNKLQNKNICDKQSNFTQFVQDRIKLYNINSNDMIIEGHYHYGFIDKDYINIPSFCCDSQYLLYNKKFEFITYNNNEKR